MSQNTSEQKLLMPKVGRFVDFSNKFAFDWRVCISENPTIYKLKLINEI